MGQLLMRFLPIFVSPIHVRSKGIVVNQHGVSVGELLGDGVVLSFSRTDVVGEFMICLRLSNTSDAISPTFPVADFGYSDASLQLIYPLGNIHHFDFDFS